jgi:chromosome segregation ATPase
MDNLERLQKAIDEAKKRVGELEDEQKTLLEQRDAKSLRRLEEIRFELVEAKLAAIDAEIEFLQEKQKDFGRQRRELGEIERAAFEKVKQAQAAHIEIQRQYARASAIIHDCAIRVGQLRRKRAEILDELKNTHAPVVRSVWQRLT